MNDENLRRIIAEFSGNIAAGYNLARTLREEFDVDLDINFDSTSSPQRFTNIVRNMISRNVIQRPIKAGRTLILREREFLQLVVARKYMSAGCSLDSLSNYLVEMQTDDIYARLFATHLPDIDKLTRQSSDSDRTESRSSSDLTGGPTALKNVFAHVKVDKGLVLQVKLGSYSEKEIYDMVGMLDEYLNRRSMM